MCLFLIIFPCLGHRNTQRKGLLLLRNEKQSSLTPNFYKSTSKNAVRHAHCFSALQLTERLFYLPVMEDTVEAVFTRWMVKYLQPHRPPSHIGVQPAVSEVGLRK